MKPVHIFNKSLVLHGFFAHIDLCLRSLRGNAHKRAASLMPETESALIDTAPQPIPDYGRLTNDERHRIRLMAAANMTQTQMAQEIGCSQSTVCQWLKVSYNPVETATDKVRQALPELADRYIAKARPQDIIETFRDFGVQTKKAPDGGKSGGVTVIVGAEDSNVQVNLEVIFNE